MEKMVLGLWLWMLGSLCAQAQALTLPSKAQLAWHKQAFYLFVHFGPNTFTDKEWGEGTEPEDIFNPTELDCRQWCRIAKAAGATGIIITAKHHDGFCLWPSKLSEHTVKQSTWKGGRGDVLKELSTTCKEYGLRFGVYLSPWDRNHPQYGTPAYNAVFAGMMKEIFQSYGPIWELWWDGANGEGPNGKKQVYDWKLFERTVRSLSPSTVVFSDVGPDIRWCGNERGTVGETVWNFLDTTGFTRGLGAPPTDTLQTGNYYGRNWMPAECDVSIRPGWFYHKEEDDKVKTPEEIFRIYLQSVGRGANLLLNVPPDRRGLIHATDSTALVGFARLLKQNFGEEELSTAPHNNYNVYVNGNKRPEINNGSVLRLRNNENDSVKVVFNQPGTINALVLREDLAHGQRVRSFTVIVTDTAGEKTVLLRTSIGAKRVVLFPTVKASSVTIRFNKADAPPVILPLRFYCINEDLIKK